jgi:hypothetical protein
MSSTMERAYIIMNDVMSSIVVEVISPLHVDVAGSEIPLEKCKSCLHNCLGGQHVYYHKSSLTLCQARFVANKIARSHFLGGRSDCYKNTCIVKPTLK